MHRTLATLALLTVASCATAPPPKPASPQPPPASAASNRLTPVASVPKAIAEPKIRVGLLTDQNSVTFPRVAGGYYIVGDGGAALLKRGFTISAPLANAVVRWAVQAAAVTYKPSVDELAERLRKDTGLRVDVVFDPSSPVSGGLYRVFVGEFPDAAAAQPLREQLVQKGYERDMIIVRRPSVQPFERRHEIVDDEEERATLAGESLLVMPASAETVTINNKPYRTAARVFINQRGLLNVINELNLEDYLRGVVPAELGPRVYDELEAQKAQTIAARTYAVRNLGQFAAEGFDLCPGPACQAYHGFSGEEPLSDQAVRETAGLIMTHEGKPIDALYTSTCGGETSDVGTMFPGRTDPYLKRARCVEMEMTSLDGRADGGLLSDVQAQARIFAALARVPDGGRSWSARDVVAAAEAALRLSGGTAGEAAPPASSRRGDVLAYLSRLFRLEEKGRVLTMPEDRRYFFPRTAQPESPAHAAAAFLIKYGIVPAQAIDTIDLSAPMPREETYALLASWLREFGALADASGKIAAVDGRTVALKSEGKIARFALPAGIPMFRRIHDRFQEYRELPVMIGDRASVVQSRGTPVALIVHGNFDGASFDRTSSYANWTRSYRADELVTSINRRAAITQLLDIRPVTVDASNRVAELEVTAEGGRTFTLRGLPVRWSLNIPDNLFAYEKTRDADGVDRYTFFGKGWGHGIGMCQVGAYGMAFRGAKAEEILKRYYTGIAIERWRP